jgi:hypothetical protein
LRGTYACRERGSAQAYDRVSEVPERLRNRILAVRSFDANAMIIENQLVDGNEIEPVLEKLLAPSNVDYLHVHFTVAGCYAARVEKA